MLNAFASLKCSKKCEHNVQRPTSDMECPKQGSQLVKCLADNRLMSDSGVRKILSE